MGFDSNDLVKNAGMWVVILVFAIIFFNTVFPRGFKGDFTLTNVNPPYLFSVFLAFLVVSIVWYLIIKWQGGKLEPKDLIPVVVAIAIVVGYVYYSGGKLPTFFMSAYNMPIVQSVIVP